ncbi:MAG: sigma D regulator [Oceanospirillaceae bacterium]|nr:sigma D regulator [Oceanospirillaceae bacterium]
MLENCQTAQERWGGVSEIIDAWLSERQALISAFVALPSANINDELNSRLSMFCDLLMDYLSSGHFEVYEQLLLEGKAFADGSAEAGEKILPQIQPSTDIALDFNDDFQGFDNPSVSEIRDFSTRLSQLGESLEERFNLEDKMIAVLHDSHREQVPAES